MQTKVPVEVDRSICFPWLRDGDRSSKIVIGAVAVRDDHVQSVNRASLKDRHENFLFPVRAF
jgi:hypothetical protein